MPVGSIRHGVILAAGLGTRLYPLTLVRSKAAVPLGGEPLIRRIVRWLASNEITELVVNLHHLPSTITAVLGDGSDLGASVRYSWEQPAILGSAGGPRQALPMLGVDSFVLVNADVWTEMDLGPLEAAHRSSNALVTLTLVPHPEPFKYGGVVLDSGGAVTGFVRRSMADSASHHFIGVQIVEAGVFRDLPAGRPMSSIGDVYDRLLASHPGSVRGFLSHAPWWDIGTVSDYVHSSMAVQSTAHAAIAPMSASTIDPTARLIRTIVWDDVRVGAGAELEDCIVTDGVQVPAGARYSRTILVRAPGNVLATFPLENR